MTEKRFVAIGVEWTDGFIQDHISDRDLFNVGAVCNLLNELSEENEQLKSYNGEMEDYLARLEEKNEQLKKEFEQGMSVFEDIANANYQHFKLKVFELIDMKIKHYSHKPISAPAGQPLSVNFDADVDRLARLSELQQLKEELQE